jgi:hypothetical protein
MINNFEQLPFVYQLESLIHVKHLGSAGIQPPYDYQTLEDGLKKQALRI